MRTLLVNLSSSSASVSQARVDSYMVRASDIQTSMYFGFRNLRGSSNDKMMQLLSSCLASRHARIETRSAEILASSVPARDRNREGSVLHQPRKLDEICLETVSRELMA